MVLLLSTLAGAADMAETDIPTVLAIGATTYVGSALIHEGLGHEGWCELAGGRAIGFSVAVAGCEPESNPGIFAASAAGGFSTNLIVGTSFGTALALAPPDDGAAHYFMWLNAGVHLLQGAGYMMVGPWVPVGDAGTEGILRDVDRRLPAQIGLTVAGAGITFGTIPLLHQLGKPLFGSDRALAQKRRRLLTWIPYFAGGTLVTASAALSRLGPAPAATSAVANFAGTLFLFYLPVFFSDDVFIPGEPYAGTVKPIRRQVGWWVVGSVAAVSAVAVFGPGIGNGFDRPHPLDPR